MAFTTHPNQLGSRRGLRAGLIGLAFVALAAVAALGFSVVDYDSQVAPAVVKFPSNEPENQMIRDQVAAAGVEAPAVVKFPSNEPENQMIRDQLSGHRAAAAPASC